MKDIKINLKTSDIWKVQLTIAINFITSKDADEERVLHSKSDLIEFMSYDNANKVVNKLFVSLFSIYQISLKISMRRRDFNFDSVQVVHDKSP